MKRFQYILASSLALVFVANSHAQIVIQGNFVIGGGVANGKENKSEQNRSKLAGTWEAKKLAQGLPSNAKWEFKKDGNVVLSAPAKADLNRGGKGNEKSSFPDKIPVAIGTYKVDGDTLTINLKVIEDGKEVAHKTTITKLTDNELQTKDEKGKINEFTKK